MPKTLLSPTQQAARAENVIASLLDRKLIVPKIFFEAAWPARKSRVDVLAVDKSGAGDIHAVEVKVGGNDLENAVAKIMEVPAHFRYVAVVSNRKLRIPESGLYAEDGMGRVGVIRVFESGDTLAAAVEISPERFRLDPAVIRQIDRFTATEHADIETRA